MAKRWQERFEQYQKALTQLDKAVSLREYSELERAGLIQVFEYTFELGWKLMQDYCREAGYTVIRPLQDVSMTFGLRDTDIQYMHDLFRQHPEIDEVWIYGSRARGTHRPGSDVDLALVGPDVTFGIVVHIHFVLEEDSPMPFFFDVTHWNTVRDEKFKEKVRLTSQLIYQKTSSTASAPSTA